MFGMTPCSAAPISALSLSVNILVPMASFNISANVGNIYITSWGLFPDTQNPSWAGIGTAQTPAWAELDTSQNPAWVPLNNQ